VKETAAPNVMVSPSTLAQAGLENTSAMAAKLTTNEIIIFCFLAIIRSSICNVVMD
jgi:hypothetical protein